MCRPKLWDCSSRISQTNRKTSSLCSSPSAALSVSLSFYPPYPFYQNQDTYPSYNVHRSRICPMMPVLRLTKQSSATKTSRLNSSKPSASTSATARSSDTRKPARYPVWAAA